MSITRTYSSDPGSSITNEIKKHHSRVFRKAYIRRRASTSPYAWESTWLEITRDVKSWGTVGTEIDHERYSVSSFIGTNLVVDNESGRYNRNANTDSLWYGYADYQQTLVKIECGFIHEWKDTEGIWHHTTYPTNPTVFIGIISGDVNLSDKAEVTLPVKTSIEYLRTFPAYPFAGTADTVEEFLTAMRDVTQSGAYFYRPLWGDSAGGIQIDTVTPSDWYTYIPTMERGFTMWDFCEETFRNFNCFLNVKADGSWRLRTKDITTTVAFKFFGRSRGATPDGAYGHTIKEVEFYGPKVTSYHSPVVLSFSRISSFAPPIAPTNYSVDAAAAAGVTGVYGSRPLVLENALPQPEYADDITDMFSYYLNAAPGADPEASGQAIVDDIVTSIGRVDEHIEFKTSLITHLNLLDRVEVTFDSSGVEAESGLWDLNKWDTELVWDAGQSGSIVLTAEAFKILSIKINLDNLETTFICRQIN